MARMDKELFSFTERCLRNYHYNLADIRKRTEYIQALAIKSPSDFSDVLSAGGEDIPWMQRMVEAEDTDDELLRLRKRTEPITDFMSLLTDEEKIFISMKYFQCASWAYMADRLHVAEVTLRTRWRARLVTKAARLLLGPIV